jgi:4-amino-4-deoxy-L-arabinose transferase-like glycosyltransferase
MKIVGDISESGPTPAVAPVGGVALRSEDARNLCLVLLGFAVVLLLIPPARAYPMSDDWAYAQSVRRLLDLRYRPHDWTQPAALGHLIWGALFSLVFGFSFTTLTAATLLISAACLAVFYLLLRYLGVASPAALLGTALLGVNPMYVYLSYSFMTDITFMLYLLAGCLFYLRAVQGRGDLWLLLGSVAAALAYLTRQLGIVLVPAMLFFLWWSKQLSWRNALFSSALPLLAAAIYLGWEWTQPAPLVSQLVTQVMYSQLSDPLGSMWLQLRRSVVVLQLPGLCLLPLVFYFRSRHPLFATPIFVVLFLFQFNVMQVFGTAFPAFGSLVDHTGLLMYDYAKQPLWSEQLWTLLGILGTLSISLFLASCIQVMCSKIREKRRTSRQAQADPAIFVYTVALLLTAVTFASPFLFDRYLLPIVAIIMLYPLRRMSAYAVDLGEASKHLKLVWLLITPIALFSLLAMRDYQAHAKARWDAAEQLAAAGARHQQVNAGFEWMGWYLFDAGVERIRQTGDLQYVGAPYRAVLDPLFLVSDLPQPGYVQIDSVPYDSWISGGLVNYVLVLRHK